MIKGNQNCNGVLHKKALNHFLKCISRVSYKGVCYFLTRDAMVKKVLNTLTWLCALLDCVCKSTKAFDSQLGLQRFLLIIYMYCRQAKTFP